MPKYGKIFCCAVGVDSPLGIFWRGCNEDLSYFHVIDSAGLTKREAGLDRLHTLNINLMTLLALYPFKYKLYKVGVLVWFAHHSSLSFAQFTANAESTLVKLWVIWGNLLNLSRPQSALCFSTSSTEITPTAEEKNIYLLEVWGGLEQPIIALLFLWSCFEISCFILKLV